MTGVDQNQRERVVDWVGKGIDYLSLPGKLYHHHITVYEWGMNQKLEVKREGYVYV